MAVTVPLATIWPDGLPFLQALAVLAPLLPVVLFTYFVVRFSFLQVFVERTVLYAAAAVLLLLLYQLALHNVHARIEERYGVNAEILQGTLVFALVLLIPALRRRLLESLRYFVLGGHIDALREQIRRIAIHITEHAGEPPAALFAHVAREIEQALSVAYVAGWLADDKEQLNRLGSDGPSLSATELTALYAELANRPHRLFTRHDAPGREAHAALVSADASAAMAFSANRVRGLIVFGRRARNRDFGKEEASILMVLAEQLAVAMDNSLLQAQQLAAERLAFQNERLTTLGLLAMRRGARSKEPPVLDQDDRQRGGRRSRPRQPALRGSAPGDQRNQPAGVDDVATAGLCATGARRRHARLGRHDAHEHAGHFAASCARAGDRARGRSARAASRGGRCVRGLARDTLQPVDQRHRGRGARRSRVDPLAQENGHVVTEVHDTGPGIAPEIQDRLFRPFMTTKEAGTGLGLYIVSCHVREAGGEIHCQSQTNQGTTFVIRLPVAER